MEHLSGTYVILQILWSRAHVTLLTLPPVLFVPDIEPYAATLLRHLIEDAPTLQAAMEASIRSLVMERETMRQSLVLGAGYAGGEEHLKT
jgi:hypothetical protein